MTLNKDQSLRHGYHPLLYDGDNLDNPRPVVIGMLLPPGIQLGTLALWIRILAMKDGKSIGDLKDNRGNSLNYHLPCSDPKCKWETVFKRESEHHQW